MPSNLEAAVEAIKKEIKEEANKPNPNYHNIQRLIKHVNTIQNSIRESVIEEEYDDTDSSGPFPYLGVGPRIPRAAAPRLSPIPTIPDDIMNLVNLFLKESPMAIQKAKSMIECADMLRVYLEMQFEPEKKLGVAKTINSIYEHAVNIIRKEFEGEGVFQKVEPAIRKLDLESET